MTRGGPVSPSAHHRLNTRSGAAWDALTDALTVETPGCSGDPRFTADAPTEAEVADMAALCAWCSIFTECEAFARSMPSTSTSGFWAGRRRGVGRADYRRREAAA